jgi:hypothetical protein
MHCKRRPVIGGSGHRGIEIVANTSRNGRREKVHCVRTMSSPSSKDFIVE